MSEYVFRDADGFGCDMEEPHESGNGTVGEYLAANNTDHYGTLHEEIVRCGDCAYYDDEHGLDGWGPKCWRDPEHSGTAVWTRPDGFCAWAERKEDGDDR